MNATIPLLEKEGMGPTAAAHVRESIPLAIVCIQPKAAWRRTEERYENLFSIDGTRERRFADEKMASLLRFGASSRSCQWPDWLRIRRRWPRQGSVAEGDHTPQEIAKEL